MWSSAWEFWPEKTETSPRVKQVSPCYCHKQISLRNTESFPFPGIHQEGRCLPWRQGDGEYVPRSTWDGEAICFLQPPAVKTHCQLLVPLKGDLEESLGTFSHLLCFFEQLVSCSFATAKCAERVFVPGEGPRGLSPGPHTVVLSRSEFSVTPQASCNASGTLLNLSLCLLTFNESCSFSQQNMERASDSSLADHLLRWGCDAKCCMDTGTKGEGRFIYLIQWRKTAASITFEGNFLFYILFSINDSRFFWETKSVTQQVSLFKLLKTLTKSQGWCFLSLLFIML